MRSPFTGLRAALMEIKNFRASGWLMFSICAIALIPLVYAGLFLLAFLDPYGNLVDVPAAVVNLDKGAELDGEDVNVGQMLCDSLIENNEDRAEGQASGYDWHFVGSVEQADKGLEDATYYMEIIIPEDFSENIASAAGDDPKQAELQVYLNPSTNLIATTVGQSMVTKIKAELNSTLDETFFDNIFVSITEVGDGLGEAADGAGELAGGLGSAVDGAGTIGSGADQLAAGADKLTDGARQLQDGSSTLSDGLSSAASGAGQLDAGIGQLADGLQQLQDGIAAGGDSTAALAQALSGVASSLEAGDFSTALQYAGAVKQANPAIGDDLYAYVSALASAAAQYQQASADAASASGVMDQKKAAMDEAGAALASPQSALEAASAGFGSDLQAFAATLQAFQAAPGLESAGAMAQAGAKIVSSSTNGSGVELLAALQGFSSALQSYQAAAADYQAAAAGYQTAATAQAESAAAASEAKGACVGYLTGVKNTSAVAADSTGQISGALDQMLAAVNGQLKPGSSALADGVASAAEGSKTITYNLGSVASGSGTIASSLRALAAGAAALGDGLGSAVEGADELAKALNDAADEVADSASDHERRAEVMASPVIANGEFETGETITQVPNYGTGFAPYFIGLGMWVGCLMISFLIRALNNRILMSRSSSASAVLSSYIPMVGIAWIQVIILLLFIQFGLGFSVRFPLWYYLFGLLVACCFAAIVQFFRASMGTSGLVVIVVLLMLQLCTAAGTFPIEAELPVFNVLNPLLPMTYVVQGFRMAMCGLSAGYMVKPAVVLACFTVAFLFLSTLWAHHCRRASMTTLYPKIQMVG